MTIAQETTASPSYDPENLGTWTGQLPNPDLVDQLPPADTVHPLPDLDNTVKTLFYWAMDLDIPHGPRLALLTILRHIDWKEGSGCRVSLPTLAKEAQFSIKTMAGHIKYLLAQNLITRHRRMSRPSETRLNTTTKADTTRRPTVSVETTPTVSVETTLTSQRSGNASNQSSSSTNPFNQKVPRLVDAKRVDDSEPEPGVTTGVEFFSLEEERTGTEPGRQPTPEPSKPTEPTVSAPPPPSDLEEARAFVDAVLPEIPTDSEIEPLGKHCWSAWSKHWGGGWAAAWPTWTKDTAGRKKFRSDVVAQLAKVGLPQPMAPDPENDLARERSAAWLDQLLAEGPKRMVDMKCAGCGRKRQLKPGETHCYACRNLSEAPKLASLPGPAIWKTDEYEKVIEDNLRRYHQEAHGPTPEDAKVEAVGAALDAG